jgi:alkylated DNA repair dioxygenase AlkB
MQAILTQIFTEDEADEIYDYLLTKEIEYHKPYKRFNRMVKVPRGQASYTLSEKIHYNYGNTAGGSPVNEVMDERLREITRRVNEATGNNYNTILMNVYKDGRDNIALHQDKEFQWVPGTGFATVAFGVARPFQIEHNDTKDKQRILHTKGLCIEMPYPMNQHYKHGIPTCSTDQCRISLTFREVRPSEARGEGSDPGGPL